MNSYEKVQMLKSWFVADFTSEKNSLISALIKLYADDIRNELYKDADKRAMLLTVTKL